MVEIEAKVLKVVFKNENEMSASKLQGCGDTVWQAGVSFISNMGFYVSLFDYNLII